MDWRKNVADLEKRLAFLEDQLKWQLRYRSYSTDQLGTWSDPLYGVDSPQSGADQAYFPAQESTFASPPSMFAQNIPKHDVIKKNVNDKLARSGVAIKYNDVSRYEEVESDEVVDDDTIKGFYIRLFGKC